MRSPYMRPELPPLELDGPRAAPASDRVARVIPDFAAIYDEHADFVWQRARRQGVAERHLEDVVQEVFLVVHKRLDTFEGRSSMRTWLYGIMLGVVRNHRRTLRRKPLSLSEEAAAAIETAPVSERERPDVAAERRELRGALFAVLDKLPDDLREVLVMAELEQMSGPDIAAVTGLKPATVYGRLRTARAAFEAAVKRFAGRNR